MTVANYVIFDFSLTNYYFTIFLVFHFCKEMSNFMKFDAKNFQLYLILQNILCFWQVYFCIFKSRFLLVFFSTKLHWSFFFLDIWIVFFFLSFSVKFDGFICEDPDFLNLGFHIGYTEEVFNEYWAPRRSCRQVVALVQKWDLMTHLYGLYLFFYLNKIS